MKFSELLSQYLDQFSVSQKELANRSGLSPATISRYLSGERKPAYGSIQVRQLAEALCSIAEAGGADISGDKIDRALNAALPNVLLVDYDTFLGSLNHLLKYMGIRTSELARGIFSDASHVSKILSGSRRPGNINSFVHEVSFYLANRFINSEDLSSLLWLINTDPDEITSTIILYEKIVFYLSSNSHIKSDDSFSRFVALLDNFDLNDYLKAMHFEAIKLLPEMSGIPVKKECTGIQNMMESELEFMKMTALSENDDDCIFYSDMPIEEMASDSEFPKKYMLGMAMMLKKGLHLNVIHDVNRPFPEMMIGLESWIPLYMTGQITPYYFPSPQSNVFLHFLKVSGAATLEGTAIAGHQSSGKYYLSSSKEDVKQCRIRAEQMLSKALPLMDIYRKDRESEFRSVLRSVFSGGDSDMKMICSRIPVCVLPEDLLMQILDTAGPDPSVKTAVLSNYKEQRETFLRFLGKNTFHLVLPTIQYAADQLPDGTGVFHLSLADLFIEDDIPLTNEQSLLAVTALQDMAAENPNFTLEQEKAPAFFNINIIIQGDRSVIVSKEKSPSIHFVIHHRKMIRAFQNFIPPLVSD